MKRLTLACLFLVAWAAPALADTHYMATTGTDSGTCGVGAPCLTIRYAFTQMAGGDLLTIADGTYTGTGNIIDGNTGHQPPSGSAGAYTEVRATNLGAVTFDGEAVRSMFDVQGGGHNYIIYRGLKWLNSSTNGVDLEGASYTKFIRCAATTAAGSGNVHSFLIGNGSYILLEDCWAWGHGRYKFIAIISDHVIFRRCVGRVDGHSTIMPVSTIMNYASSYVEVQNCIAIDYAADYLEGGAQNEGAYDTHTYYVDSYTEYSNWTGSLGINVPGSGIELMADAHHLTFRNMAFADVTTGALGQSPATTTMDHLTVAHTISLEGIYDWTGSYGVTNSILYGAHTWGIRNAVSSDYNSFYANTSGNYSGTSPGAHDITATDPTTAALWYPVRIEPGSFLDGAASDGGDIGATILKRLGTDETLWGETGYATLTDVDLWPFPNEAEIRTDMRTYTGGAAADRGFCADGTTLTDYVWRYLGHTPPPFGASATGGILHAHVSWSAPDVTTNVTGYEIERLISGTWTLAATIADPATLTAQIDDLPGGTTQSFRVVVVDSVSGDSGPSEVVTADVEAGEKEPPVAPVPTGVTATPAFAAIVVEWDAVTPANELVQYTVYFLSGGTYYNTFATGPGTATTFTIHASQPYAAWTVKVASMDSVLGESELSAAATATPILPSRAQKPGVPAGGIY